MNNDDRNDAPKNGRGSSADALLRRIRSNIGSSADTKKGSDEQSSDEPDINSRVAKDQKISLSLEEMYDYDPVVREVGSNIDHRGRSASNRPTKKRSFDKKSTENGDISDFGDRFATDTEIDLMSIFGMEKKEADTDRAESDLTETSADDPYADEAAFRSFSSAKRVEEYTSPTQNKKLFSSYRKRYIRSIFSMLVCGLLFCFCCLLEFAPALGIDLPSFFDHRYYPGVTALLELQTMVLFVAMMPKKFLHGLSSLFVGKGSADSLFSLTVTASAIYAICISGASGGDDVAFFGSVAALSAVFASISEHLDTMRELYSFGIVASSKEKLVLYRKSRREAASEIEHMSRYLPEDNKYLAVTKSKRISDFYANFNALSPSTSGGRFMIMSGLLVALAFGIFILVKGGGANRALASAYTVLMTALPFSLYFVYAYPLCRLSRRARKHGSAIIGSSALDRYTAPATVTFGDDDIFPEGSVRIASFKNYGSTSLDKVLHHAAAVLCPTGGSLGKLLESIADSFEITDDMEFLSVSDDGIEAAVDGDHVFMGSYHYIVRNHLTIPYDVDVDEGRDVFMFMSIGNEVVAKFRLAYTPSPDFKGILDKLAAAGMTVAIKTFDPNVDLSLLCRTLGIDEKQPIKVIHTHDPLEVYEVKETISSPLVSIGSLKSLTETLHRTEKTRRTINTCSVIAGMSTFIAAIVMGVTLAMTDISTIPAYYISLYQLFWMLPSLAVARIFS